MDQEQLTTASGTIASGDMSFPVVDASQISPGLIEVDEELMWCSRIDPDANIVYVAIRGYAGSTAAAHSANAVVRNQPKFPRFSIIRALNDTIRSSYPDVFGVDTTQLTANSAQLSYNLPADVELVLDATYDTLSSTRYWAPLRRYAVDMGANAASFPGGKSLTVFDAMLSGRTVQITYRKVPGQLVALTDTLTSTGLNDSAKELLVYGACSRLVGYLQPAQMATNAAEARLLENSNRMASGATYMDVGRYYYTMYLQAKAEEVRRLLDRYPPRIHFVR
jgi:hypothetical protein